MAHLAHYREAHPLPFVITHWINMVCMMILILTGLLIHFPFIPGVMGIVRGVHIFCGIVVAINLIVRVVLSFFIKSAQVGGTRVKEAADFKNFLPSKKNRHQWFPWIKYYLFAKRDHPIGTKYGSPQKLVYFILPFLILASALTGFCLWSVTASWPICLWFTGLVGGIMNVRMIHYVLMWAFVIFIIIHVYLANIEGSAPSKLMFLRREHGGKVTDPETGKVIGEDDLTGKDARPDEPLFQGEDGSGADKVN